MCRINPSPGSVAAAREQHRLISGQFGVQPRDEAPLGADGVDLSPAAPVMPVPQLESNEWGARWMNIVDPNSGEVLSDVAHEYDESQNLVDVAAIHTPHEHRGRGYASLALAALIDEHPDATFDTSHFASPWARRLWERQFEAAHDRGHFPIDATLDDERCRQCLRRLDDEQAQDPRGLCDGCLSSRDEHASGAHSAAAPPENCWTCHA